MKRILQDMFWRQDDITVSLNIFSLSGHMDPSLDMFHTIMDIFYPKS